MMDREFSRILSQYGQDMTVYTQTAPEGVTLRAFFQPMRDRGTAQTVPSPLGQVKQDRFLYLGPAKTALDDTCRVEVQGEIYQVESAHAIHVGGTPTHWWAVLSRRAKEVAE